MKKYLIAFLFLHISWNTSFGQTERYTSFIFPDVTILENITFGKSTTQGGVEIDLKMNIYLPEGDTLKNRPLIVLAHGGYFFFGEKENFDAECRDLAKSGFVAATIDYRLIDVPDDSFFVAKKAVIDAVNDMKAAVRYFYKDAAHENKYGVDTSNIFIGGYSAGAITSLHYAYANTATEILKMGGNELLEYVYLQGGIGGKSGNPGYSTKVKGVINIAGSLFMADLIDKGEPILFSVHGTDDDIVPYEEGTTGTTKVKTEGSGLLHKRAEKLRLINHLETLEGLDHSGFYYCRNCMSELKQFLKDNL